MQEKNLIEVELLESDEVNKKSDFIIGFLLVALLIIMIVAFASSCNDNAETNSSSSTYLSSSSSSVVDYSNDDSYTDYDDSDYGYSSNGSISSAKAEANRYCDNLEGRNGCKYISSVTYSSSSGNYYYFTCNVTMSDGSMRSGEIEVYYSGSDYTTKGLYLD